MVYEAVNKGYLLVGKGIFTLAVICLIVASVIFLRTPALQSAQEVRVDEEAVTLQMNPNVLINSLKENASNWCSVSRTVPIFGDIAIKSPKDNVGIQMFKQVMLTDSMAPNMAKEYPNLFKYKDEGGKISFTMSSSRNSVAVPVWLVKALIDGQVLRLPAEITYEQNKAVRDQQ